VVGYGTALLRRAMTPEEASGLTGTFTPPATPTITTGTLAADADTGTPLFAYLPAPDTAGLLAAVLAIDFGTANYRTFGTATHSQPAVIMRYVDRLVDLLNTVASGCATHTDTRYGVINKSNPHTYHRDGGTNPPKPPPTNTPWGAVVYLRHNTNGGHLSLPEYNTTVAHQNGWVLFFPSAEHLHGVTPMRHNAAGYRYSVLYGTVPGAKECFTGTRPTSPGWDMESHIQDLHAPRPR
jgi:hypothetical protein